MSKKKSTVNGQRSAIRGLPSPDSNYFVTVEIARNKILKTVKTGPVVLQPLTIATGCVLAENIKALYHAPPFDQSAMDGYAFRFADLKKNNPLTISGAAVAGKNFDGTVKKDETVRIFTGAAVPRGADTVVMQEKVSVNKQQLHIGDNAIQKGANIRKQGSHLRKGSVAVTKGTLINTGTTGYLAAIGIGKVRVYKKPAVSIIITGEELVPPGSKLKPGQIFESNSAALIPALKSKGIENIRTIFTGDNLKATQKLFKKEFRHSDFIIFTGGISVGDHDHTGTVMQLEKVKTVFYKVQQKPGKPLFFGEKSNKYIFGLPGNPASVLTCFYLYVRPALQKAMGFQQPLQDPMALPLTQEIKKKPGLTHFLKAVTDFRTVTPLPGQESYIMTPFVKANCLVELPPDSETIEKGSNVIVHLI